MGIPVCSGCRTRDARIAELEGQLAELQRRVAELEARLGTNSTNSSVPPSANPLGAPNAAKSPARRFHGTSWRTASARG